MHSEIIGERWRKRLGVEPRITPAKCLTLKACHDRVPYRRTLPYSADSSTFGFLNESAPVLLAQPWLSAVGMTIFSRIVHWRARLELQARLAAYTLPDPDVAYQQLVSKLRGGCTESSSQTLIGVPHVA